VRAFVNTQADTEDAYNGDDYDDEKEEKQMVCSILNRSFRMDCSDSVTTTEMSRTRVNPTATRTEVLPVSVSIDVNDTNTVTNPTTNDSGRASCLAYVYMRIKARNAFICIPHIPATLPTQLCMGSRGVAHESPLGSQSAWGVTTQGSHGLRESRTSSWATYPGESGVFPRNSL
jgi:hypothetical protein